LIDRQFGCFQFNYDIKITVQPTTSIINIGDELVGEVSIEGILKDDTETYHYSQLLFFHRSFYFVVTYTDLADNFSDNSQDYSEIKNSIVLGKQRDLNFLFRRYTTQSTWIIFRRFFSLTLHTFGILLLGNSLNNSAMLQTLANGLN
jgi:hypothetical protein